MTSSSSSPSARAFCSRVYKYHVFLSFRGEDTRKNFVDHLYTALVQQGINTYKDDETRPRGESIGPSLMTAIEESQIAVVVFSRNYANSPCCLDELAYIMKCKDTRGQMVLPIYYDIDPSKVRKQKRKYGEAFVIHDLENKKVESRRKALFDASSIVGWEAQHVVSGHESKYIKDIVETIAWKLGFTTRDLIGMNVRVKDFITKLQIGLVGVRMIGIWGVGGSGKTALASSVYDEISRKFDGCCFIENVLGESRSYELEILQEKLLSDVLKQRVHVGSVEEGRRMIKDRLQHRKVLIVLDDVDNIEHLEELAGSRDWFGDGSRIIITTRDLNLLTAHKVDVIHSISLLNNDEAIELFLKHSYPRYRPLEDYEQSLKDMVSLEVVSYAAGLPLALQVLGHFLFDKEIDKWRSALARLIQIPNQITHIHDLVQDMALHIFGREQSCVKVVLKKHFEHKLGTILFPCLINLARLKQYIESQPLFQVAADTKNRRLIDLNTEQRVQVKHPLPEDFPPGVQKQRKYCKEDLVNEIIKPLFPKEDLIVLQGVAHLKIPLRKLNLATNNFSEEHFLTRGGFGKVYRAQYEDGFVAIKKLDIMNGQGHPQFMMEIALLSAYKHENLVSLVGFCDEGGEKILVYKYESNGSLDRHLHRKDLRWTQRIQICLDAACGLKYLHDDTGIQHRILHRDMKSSNILLDGNFAAKISDFGLSKIALANVPCTVLISNVAGTPGYVDPEYYKHGELTQKSDVYSFGVVMFEVLCGKLGFSKHRDEPCLAEIAQSHYKKGILDEIIDSDLRNQMNSKAFSTFSDIAYQCLKCPAKDRPRMAVVVKELEKALEYQRVASKNKASS